MNATGDPRYVPAAGREIFTRLYDPVVALSVRERHFRGLMRKRVLSHLDDAGTLVDVGSGTGTFAIEVANSRPAARVIAMDGDARIVERAEAKSGADAVEWRLGSATALPLEDRSVDVVVMSLLLHHLDDQSKRGALSEAERVLVRGGTIQIADWGPPGDPLMRGAFLVLRALDGFENTRAHALGRLPDMIERAGFGELDVYQRLRTVWGRLELMAAVKP